MFATRVGPHRSYERWVSRRTGRDGRFEIVGLPETEYELRISRSPESFDENRPTSRAMAGERSVEVVVEPQCGIYGRVQFVGQAPERFWVSVNGVAQSFDSAAGRYDIAVRGAGRAQLELAAEGFATLARELRLEPAEARALNFILEPGLSLRGVVVDGSSGRPVAGARLELDGGVIPASRRIRVARDEFFPKGRLGPVAYSEITKVFGEFMIPNLEGGKYTVNASGRGYESTTALVEVSAQSAAKPILITLEPRPW